MQKFRTLMKTLLHCGYEYLLNLLVTLVVAYKKSLIPSQVIKL